MDWAAVDGEVGQLVVAVLDFGFGNAPGKGVGGGADVDKALLQRLRLHSVPMLRAAVRQQNAAVQHQRQRLPLLQAGEAHQCILGSRKFKFDFG